jgi:hypothetical protein
MPNLFQTKMKLTKWQKVVPIRKQTRKKTSNGVKMGIDQHMDNI